MGETGEKPIELQIKKQKWKWTGHTIRKDENAVERIVLDWNPQGTRKSGRPKKTWRMSVVEEAWREGRTWREMKRLAMDRSLWRSFMKVLCSYTGDSRIKSRFHNKFECWLVGVLRCCAKPSTVVCQCAGGVWGFSYCFLLVLC